MKLANVLQTAYHRDMFRTILATLTIAGLLLCPLRCSATSPAEGGEVGSGCGCCQSACEDQPAQPNDDSPRDGCECTNCLCHGAVLEGDTKLPPIVFFPLSFERPQIEFALTTPSAQWLSRTERNREPCCLSGRAVCVLQQSLQI